MPYLLSTQAAADFISRNPCKLRDWANQQNPIEVSASVISIAVIRADLEASSKTDRTVWLRYLRDFAHQLERDGRLLSVSREVADRYADIRNIRPEDATTDVGEDERLVLATALAFGLTWIGEQTPATQVLAPHGLEVLDPERIPGT